MRLGEPQALAQAGCMPPHGACVSARMGLPVLEPESFTTYEKRVLVHTYTMCEAHQAAMAYICPLLLVHVYISIRCLSVL